MKRDFDDIIENLKTTIAGYDYYVDFKKVYGNVFEAKTALNILNTLIGDVDNFDKDFITLIHRYPEALRAIPILLAVRAEKINVMDKELISFNFSKRVNTDEEYLRFVEKTGIKELITAGHVRNLVDYVTGVEVGLDSNARKNRGGTAMEDLVEGYLKSFPEISSGVIRQATKKEIIDTFGYPELETVNLTEGRSQADKVFDFAFEYRGTVFLVETNFYRSGGSKLNEVARSYEKLADDINKLPHYKFIWITDGKGWESARNNLKESYMHQNLLMTISDMEQRNLLDEIKEYTTSQLGEESKAK
jgi:type II restriction enzyme